MVINENFIVLDLRCYMHSLHVKMKSKGWNISEYLIFLDLPVKEKATTACIFLWFLNIWFFFKHLIFLHYSMHFIFTVYPAGWRHDKFVPWTTENGNFKSKWNQKTFIKSYFTGNHLFYVSAKKYILKIYSQYHC